MLQNRAWTRHAAHANAGTRRLGDRIASAPGAGLKHPVQTNAVFAQLSEAMHSELASRGWHYYRFIGGGARLMCSWATRFEEVDALTVDIAAASRP